MGLDREADVLVVGAGSAGAATAAFFARQGRRVVLVDKRPRGETGARWVNAVPKWCFDEARVARPSGDELPFGDHESAFHLVGPSRRWSVAMRDVPILHVDMRKLVSRLVEDAVAAGAQFEQAHVEDVELSWDRVRAVSFTRGNEAFRVHANLVVDASGLGAALRRRVPGLDAACPDVGPVDRCAAAEFQHEVDDPDALAALLARHGAEAGDALGFAGVAGGYSTLTLFTRRDLREVGILTGSIPSLGVSSGLEVYERFVSHARWVGKKRYGGAGSIPLRRSYATLGAHGVALVGDAACQVYASHGSGVGMGLLGARALADAAQKEHDAGDPRVLARYSSTFRRRHGGLLASSEAFRRFAQGASPDVVDGLLRSGLLDASLARDALLQRRVRFDASTLLAMPGRVVREVRAAMHFLPVAARTLLLDRLAHVDSVERLASSGDLLLGGASRRVDAPLSLPEA